MVTINVPLTEDQIKALIQLGDYTWISTDYDEARIALEKALQAQQPLKWFHYRQNNSGGYFIVNDEVAEDVFIQAPSAAEAEERAEAIFAKYSEYCECCGRRWSTGYMHDDDGYDVPCIYGTPITEEEDNYFREHARLHHYDRRIEAFTYKQPADQQ